jgi:hypothetical protein
LKILRKGVASTTTGKTIAIYPKNPAKIQIQCSSIIIRRLSVYLAKLMSAAFFALFRTEHQCLLECDKSWNVAAAFSYELFSNL